MKNDITFFGFSITEAAQRASLPWVTVWRHVHKKRKISPEYAMKYHVALDIPLSSLRPDLWSPEDSPASTQERDAEDEGKPV